MGEHMGDIVEISAVPRFDCNRIGKSKGFHGFPHGSTADLELSGQIPFTGKLVSRADLAGSCHVQDGIDNIVDNRMTLQWF